MYYDATQLTRYDSRTSSRARCIKQQEKCKNVLYVLSERSSSIKVICSRVAPYRYGMYVERTSALVF